MAEVKPTFRIIEGDVRKVLRSLPDESVNCIVTSPPYWGLRAYGTEPQVWGGLPNCEHEWGEHIEKHDVREETTAGKTRTTERFYGNESRKFDGNHQKHTAGSFCRTCGAWRGELGLEPTPELYVTHIVEVFREVRRVLRSDGTLWLNIGDSYSAASTHAAGDKSVTKAGIHGHGGESARALRGERLRYLNDGLKPKDLVMMPARVAMALQADGWYLRSDLIWSKPNPMPESVTDRPTKAHEYLFLLAKSERYHYDAEAIKEPVSGTAHARGTGVNPKAKWPSGWASEDRAHTELKGRYRPKQNASFSAAVAGLVEDRNKRSVWIVATQAFPEAHFATFPEALVEPCILAGCPPEGKRCDCDDLILTPTGDGEIADPRPRRPNEGRRPITRREQRWEASQMKNSPARPLMEAACGEAFAHYIRTDDSGARPLPERLRAEFRKHGWITEAPPCTHPAEPAGTVLDIFAGSGTVGVVALRHGRSFIGIELNPKYARMAKRRIFRSAPLILPKPAGELDEPHSELPLFQQEVSA